MSSPTSLSLCSAMPALLSRSMDRELSPASDLLRRQHLLICPSCRVLDEQWMFLRRALLAMADLPLHHLNGMQQAAQLAKPP